jgi:hypothetical protein
MSDLAHTLVLCGLLSGTQPITLMGLLLVLGGGQNPRGNGIAFLSGAFLIQTVLLIGASALIGGTVAPSSDTGHTLFGVRIGIGVLLLIFGVLLRRPPGKPVPEIPHALERLHQLRPGQSFIAGVVIADYQGPVIASFALAESSLGFAGRLVGLGFYSLIATGIPLLLMLWTTRSERARDRVTRATTSVMRNRRQIASWFAVIGGLLLIGDGILSLLTE